MTRFEKSTILELSSKTNRYLLTHFIGIFLTVILTIISTIIKYDELIALSIFSLLILSQTLFIGFEYFKKLEREYNLYGNRKGYIEIHSDHIVFYDRIEKERYKFARIYFEDILNTFIKENSKKQIKQIKVCFKEDISNKTTIKCNGEDYLKNSFTIKIKYYNEDLLSLIDKYKKELKLLA